jgi:hypothetical protein
MNPTYLVKCPLGNTCVKQIGRKDGDDDNLSCSVCGKQIAQGDRKNEELHYRYEENEYKHLVCIRCCAQPNL